MAPPAAPPYDYERDPSAIYRQSFSIVRSEAALGALPDAMQAVAIRLIHSCGMVDILDDLTWSENVVERAGAAFSNGATVLADVEMVANGIIKRLLPRNNAVVCTLNENDVPELAKRLGTTRSAAAVEHWLEHLDGAIVAVGNAPTALFHLLEEVAKGAPKPAVILGFPVGFVGAAESKQALIENPFGIPFLTIRGRRGGSAMAAAAVNALAAGLPEDTA
ncbi:precorrin-8X methylmutase [Roseibium hamelinense]|uniref:Precorrin-8X methylmutase n=1 Tax=Roseibium hamelinense TaxID=150831 RepID=A0A562T0T5_9HYPH|nr:precorrin-8X methylmutase [Roseibium hamelinense]MTI43853.1 precorrin-8X methylmutase [Roseibium hamelinense]TWI87062.1 precorrin-8X methylmutase [Roseibium hamelinense]